MSMSLQLLLCICWHCQEPCCQPRAVFQTNLNQLFLKLGMSSVYQNFTQPKWTIFKCKTMAKFWLPKWPNFVRSESATICLVFVQEMTCARILCASGRDHPLTLLMLAVGWYLCVYSFFFFFLVISNYHLIKMILFLGCHRHVKIICGLFSPLERLLSCLRKVHIYLPFLVLVFIIRCADLPLKFYLFFFHWYSPHNIYKRVNHKNPRVSRCPLFFQFMITDIPSRSHIKGAGNGNCARPPTHCFHTCYSLPTCLNNVPFTRIQVFFESEY